MCEFHCMKAENVDKTYEIKALSAYTGLLKWIQEMDSN